MMNGSDLKPLESVASLSTLFLYVFSHHIEKCDTTSCPGFFLQTEINQMKGRPLMKIFLLRPFWSAQAISELWHVELWHWHCRRDTVVVTLSFWKKWTSPGRTTLTVPDGYSTSARSDCSCTGRIHEHCKANRRPPTPGGSSGSTKFAEDDVNHARTDVRALGDGENRINDKWNVGEDNESDRYYWKQSIFCSWLRLTIVYVKF